MSDVVKTVIGQRLDLYKLLELNYKDYKGNDDAATTHSLKKQYRKLSLRYHPDKNPGPEYIDRFHLLNLAITVLADPAKKAEYDQWVAQYLYPDNGLSEAEQTRREALVQKLNASERKVREDNQGGNVADIGKIQNYGEKLRRMAHFGLGFGDWRNLDEHISRATTNTIEDATTDKEVCTLRAVFDFQSIENITDPNNLRRYMNEVFPEYMYDIDEIRYSSNNVYDGEEDIVVYIVLKDPIKTGRLYHQIKRNPPDAFVEIEPYISPKLFESFSKEIPLNDHVKNLLRGVPEVIDLD